jgi:hypothetical protein
LTLQEKKAGMSVVQAPHVGELLIANRFVRRRNIDPICFRNVLIVWNSG